MALAVHDTAVDRLALAKTKGLLPSAVEHRQESESRAELRLHQYLSPSLLGHLPRDGQLHDRGRGEGEGENRPKRCFFVGNVTTKKV